MNSQEINSTGEMGTFEKILNIFFAPRQTFNSIDRKPDWLVPMTIVVLVAVLTTVIIMPVIMPQQMQKRQLKMEEKGMSQEQIDQAMEMGARYGRIIGPIGAVVSTIIYLVVLAGILLFVGNIIMGGNTSYLKIFSVTCYSALISSLGSLLLIPIIISRKAMDVTFSLATFLPGDSSDTILYSILQKIAIFPIWQLIVIGIGIAVIYKFTTKKAMTMVASLYLLYIVISVTVKAMF